MSGRTLDANGALTEIVPPGGLIVAKYEFNGYQGYHDIADYVISTLTWDQKRGHTYFALATLNGFSLYKTGTERNYYLKLDGTEVFHTSNTIMREPVTGSSTGESCNITMQHVYTASTTATAKLVVGMRRASHNSDGDWELHDSVHTCYVVDLSGLGAAP